MINKIDFQGHFREEKWENETDGLKLGWSTPARLERSLLLSG